MSLIEKAARRLDELRQAGIEVQIPSAHDRHERGNLAAATLKAEPSQPDGLAPGLSGCGGGAVEYQTAVAPGWGSPFIGDVAVKRSREVAIDLLRLSTDGYITPDAPRTQLAEEFRSLKRPLLNNAHGKSAAPIRRANLIMVTSALPGEGKTFASINLAMSVAMEVDSTVLLVDADVARPAVLDRLGLPSSLGLLDLLTQPHLDMADVLLKTNVDRFTVLPAGTPHPRATELLASAAMGRLLDEIAVRYPDRIAVFDAPPLLLSTESRALASQVGQVILVVEADRTTQHALREAAALIENCPVVMTVLNKADRSMSSGGYYGQYGEYGA